MTTESYVFTLPVLPPSLNEYRAWGWAPQITRAKCSKCDHVFVKGEKQRLRLADGRPCYELLCEKCDEEGRA